MSQSELIRIAAEQYRALALNECFDPSDLNSRPNKKQQEILDDIGLIQYRWIIAGNQSGKSGLVGRELSWLLEDKHPKWKRPDTWLNEPFFAIVAGQNKNMLDEIWGKKIKPFLTPGMWKEKRPGGQLESVEHRKTGSKVLFISHNDSSDKRRQQMQGYVAHYVWLDEMPTHYKVLEELSRRVDARQGYFIATFTPKHRNEHIRRFIEAGQEPISKRYRMSKLDNPIYADRLEAELRKLDGMPEAYRNTILYGDWYVGDNAVYHFDENAFIEDPIGYHPSWRHVEAVDPANESIFGYTLWAECPASGVWYCVKAEHLKGPSIKVPTNAVAAVQAQSAGVNLVKRISDPEASWYINTAQAEGLHYLSPIKNNRKHELIKNLQDALSADIRIASWCPALINEFQTCQWAESGSGKIINASSYHLLDCAQYFVDLKPKAERMRTALSWSGALLKANALRKKKEVVRQKLKLRRGAHWR